MLKEKAGPEYDNRFTTSKSTQESLFINSNQLKNHYLLHQRKVSDESVSTDEFLETR